MFVTFPKNSQDSSFFEPAGAGHAAAHGKSLDSDQQQSFKQERMGGQLVSRNEDSSYSFCLRVRARRALIQAKFAGVLFFDARGGERAV